ncbi:hypothetical protein KR215_004535 [Drosophila sulfurigaster]|nr:hypothetical protein KR215_004535 [Drosophila sulfurigaster]
MRYKFQMPQMLTLLLLLFGMVMGYEGNLERNNKLLTDELPRPLTPLEELPVNQNQSERNPRSRRPTLMDVALHQSVQQGLNAMAELYGRIQPQMLLNGQTLQHNHPAALLSRFNAPNTETEHREMAAYATIEAAKAFRQNFQHIDELARQSHAQKISLRRTALEGLCPVRDAPPCMPASDRYRTHDGTCNNKRRPRWGAAQMPFNRFLPPEYGDGVDSVRSSTDGSTLSSSRFVSLLVHGAREGEAPLTLMIVQWGQLLDHDITSTAQPRSINGSIPSCCGGKDFHPSCFPIKVPLDDPWLSPLNVRCLEFLRSAPAQRRDCVLSWREQTNQATSYIDASPIYSNSAKSSDNARVFRNGLLIYGRGNPSDDVCQRGAIASKCIRAGDGRSGEQPGLLAMHHVWVGEHNRIAMELNDLNPHWSDEKIYQETRRIVGAMFQHITYREFLPLVLGNEVCKLFDLQLLSSGFYEGYDPKINPSVANSFSSAAFRFGHSLVQNSYTRCDRHHNVINNNVSLHEEFQNGDIGTAGSLHRLLRGMASQRALKRDEFITPELTNHLFQTPGFPFGLDLAAINIQRGRDHGLPPYTSWRVPCGLSPIQSWDEFANVVGPESSKRIGHAYRSVHDIDLFVGGIAERPVVGGLVGPTFACIIAQQFSNSRRGDRFWYENSGFESSFTPAQLHSLRRVSLSQVLCRAVGGGTFQPHIFIPAEFTDNERQNCGTGLLSPIDLSPWLELDPFAPPRPIHGDVDHIFNIISPNEISAPSIVKEDKAGFSNRVKPARPHIEFSPNSSNGFQRPDNKNDNTTNKVSDKLDLIRKTTTNSNSHNNNPQRKTSVNNKLDKSPKITINIKNVITRNPSTTVPKRTVIINNVPLELRKAVSVNTSTSLPKNDIPLASRSHDNPDLEGLTESSRAATVVSDATKPTNLTSKRELRRLTTLMKPSNDKTSDMDEDERLMDTQGNITEITSALIIHSDSTPSMMLGRSSRTTKSSKLSRTTKRGVELRSQYQSRPPYPQKVVVNGPNTSDQYEIEINIRQTNKSPVTRPVESDYSEYTTSTNYKPFNSYENSYAPNYLHKFASTTPSYTYYPTHRDTNLPLQKTKPPTIIYLNDIEDRRTSTRPPNIFQNFLSFATNGLNPNINKRPTEATDLSPIAAGQKPRPYHEASVVNSPLSGSYSQAGYATSGLSHPVSTSSQMGVNSPSTYLHASSSVISSGHFGSISGVASANGADSIFSFNIRPRPHNNANPYPVFSSNARPQSFGASYGYASHLPYQQSQPDLYYDRELSQTHTSPFSTGTAAGQKPWSQPQYYDRSPQLKEIGNSNNDQSNTDHKLDLRDYDYLSRTLANITEGENLHDTTEDYVYDEDEPNKIIDFANLGKQAGYLKLSSQNDIRTEFKDEVSKNISRNNENRTYVDDNYVLPMLENNPMTYVTEMPKPILSTSTNSNVSVFPDSISKKLGSKILAETIEYDAQAEILKQSARYKQHTNVAFAPIILLTKPDR